MNKSEVVEELLLLRKKLGRPVTRQDVYNYNYKLDWGIRKNFKTYSVAYEVAGINENKNDIRNSQTVIAPQVASQIVKNNEWLGRAAEYYVISELLYQGYNATRMTMDTGIDIFATKGEKTFYIQVKSLAYKSTNAEIKISVDSFSKNNGGAYYYVIVITDNEEQSRDVVILPSAEIERLLNMNIKSVTTKEIRLKVKKTEGKILINNQDESFFWNNWERII
jgi:Holliday junction resolvase